MMLRGRTAFLSPSQQIPPYEPLSGSPTFDVIVVGGGITGLTAARLLGRAGLDVGVLEAKRIGGGVTAFSTGQITSLVDAGYDALTSDFGLEGAQAVARLTRDAIDLIVNYVHHEGIQCSLRRVPTVLYAESDDDRRKLAREHEATTRAGLPTRLSDTAPELPFPVRGALTLDDQLDLDPSAYVQALARHLPSQVRLFEHTRVLAIEDEPTPVVTTDRGTLRARFVIEATHVPGGRNVYHAKTAPYRSYVIAAQTAQRLPPGIFADLLDPYHYLRDHRGLVLLGGADHKTGQRPEGAEPYPTLEAYLRARFRDAVVVERWTTELYAPADGLPYIGPMTEGSPHLIATGFDGDGLSFGTLAGKLLADHVLGRPAPEAALFRPSRAKPSASAGRLVRENVNVARHLVGDHLASVPQGTDGIAPGQGAVVDVAGRRTAAYRDISGKLHVHGATCTHMGCVVQWNPDAETFDCPCHGGCFSPTGEVLGGPPAKPLA